MGFQQATQFIWSFGILQRFGFDNNSNGIILIESLWRRLVLQLQNQRQCSIPFGIPLLQLRETATICTEQRKYELVSIRDGKCDGLVLT
jgi:hypothetical protein